MELLFLNPPVLSSNEERLERAKLAIDILNKINKNTDIKDNRFKYWINLHNDMQKELNENNLLNFQAHPVLGPSITGGSGRHYLTKICEKFGYQKFQYFLKNHTETLCGEPKDLVCENGTYITVTSMRHLYHLSRLHHICHLNFSQPVDFWEIGGGFGNLARIIAQYDLCKKYYIVDHPVMHTIQFFFLSEFFPVTDIAVLSEDGEYIAGSVDSKFQLCSSFAVQNLQKKMKSPYVLVSTMALTEIPNEYQNTYIDTFNPELIYILGQLKLASFAGGKSAGELSFSNEGLVYKLGEKFHTIEYEFQGYFFEYIGRKPFCKK